MRTAITLLLGALLLTAMPVAAAQTEDIFAGDHLVSDTAGRPDTELRRVTDGDPASGLDLLPNDELRLDLPRSHRWCDRIELAVSGGPLEILAYDWHGEEISLGTVQTSGTRTEHSSLDFEAVPLKRLVLRVPASAATARISDIAGMLRNDDPDDDDSTSEIIIEWINNYPNSNHCGEHRDEDARGVRDALEWEHSELQNDSVWEMDFKRENENGEEDTWVDARDLAYFAGHGSKKDGDRTLYIARKDRHDRHVRPRDCLSSYGEKDMEWMAFSAPLVFEDSDNRRDWADCFNGVHLILGWEGEKKDVAHGEYFGNNLVDDDDNGSDSPMKVIPAWEDAGDRSHGYGYYMATIGEEWDYEDDYVWDQGPVLTDPEVDGDYQLWQHTTRDRTDDPGGFASPDPSFLRRTHARTAQGITVLSDPLATRDLPTTMPRYQVIPQPINVADVVNLAGDLCSTLGGVRMCGVSEQSVGIDGLGHYCVTVGSDLLRVDPVTGAANLVDLDRWLSSPGQEPALPDEPTAAAQASTFLQSLERYPSDCQEHYVDWYASQTIDRVSGTILDDLLYNVRVRFGRTLGGYPVVGPGANISVSIGDGSYIERWSEGGWRPVALGEEMDLLTPQQIENLLAEQGSYATIGGINMPADEILILAWTAGYFEHDLLTQQDYIEPTYILDTAIVYSEDDGDPDTTSCRIFVNAVRLPPSVTINSPEDQTWFSESDMINFSCTANGGSPDYTIDWYSDIDGHFGSGPVVNCDLLSLSYKLDTESRVYHTITVEVTDAVGSTTRATIQVGVAENAAGADLPEPTGITRLLGSSPSPFTTSTSIRFELARRSKAELDVFDIRGARVRRLVNGELAPGLHAIPWFGRSTDGRRLPGGVYFLRLKADGVESSRKVLVTH